MKFIKLFLLSAVIIAITSCGRKNALAYNEKMVGIQQELLAKVNKMQTDTAAGSIKLKQVQDFARLKRDEIKAAASPDGAEAFKEAMVNDLTGIIESYELLIKMTQAENDETKLAPLREEFAAMEKKIEKLDKSVIEEQRKFAKANGITLK